MKTVFFSFLLGSVMICGISRAQTQQPNKQPVNPPQPQGQQGWVRQAIGTSEQVGYASALNKDTAWVSTLDGLYETTDAGTSWLSWKTPAIGAVSFIDRQNGIVVGIDAKPLHIYHTSDGGMHWDTTATDCPPWLGMTRLSRDSIFICTTQGFILRSVDGGRSWTSKEWAPLNLRGISFANSQVGFAVGDRTQWFGPPQRPDAAEVYVTTDGGESWNARYSGISVDLFAVQAFDSKHAVVGGANEIAFTMDGGDVVGGGSWFGSQVESPVPVVAMSSFPSPSIGYACGNGGSILQSRDSGHSWVHQHSGVAVNLTSIIFSNDSNGFATGEKGVILHTTDAGKDWVQISPPSDVSLGVSAYPQPSSGMVKLTYILPQVQIVTANVYDMTGRLVATLANHVLQSAGSQTIAFDGNHFPSGMYEYRIETSRYSASGQISLTK